jgi:hypothetical protein
MNTPFHFHHVSNQKRELGKKSRPGKPLKNKTQLPACIAFTFIPAVPIFAVLVNEEWNSQGVAKSKSVMSIANFSFAVRR